MKIYTRTGDKGETSLVGGRRVSKAHPRLEAYGTLDELNAVIGILRLHVSMKTGAAGLLANIQKDLFVLGAVLADPNLDHASSSSCEKLACPLNVMEADIDRLMTMAPALNSFVLPSGCVAAVHAHHARTVCRRAERMVIPLCSDSITPGWVAAYLNRLSDWLFALARAENAVAGVDEEGL